MRSGVGLTSLPQKNISNVTGWKQLRFLAQTAYASQETLLYRLGLFEMALLLHALLPV
jgi:hypothetical protein